MRSELWLRLRSAWWRIPSSRFRDPYAMTATLMQMSMRLTIAASRSRTIRTEGSIDRSSAIPISFFPPPFPSCPRSCLFENEIERARGRQTLNATSLGTHARAFCFPSTTSSSSTPSFRLAILSRRLSLFSNFLSLFLSLFSFFSPPLPRSAAYSSKR